eukprot:gene27415-33113_t
MRSTAPLSTAFHAFASRSGIDLTAFTFEREGERLFGTELPRDLGLKDGDKISLLIG